MITSLKGRLSARLLGARSHSTVSRTSLLAAALICLLIALVSIGFAVAQWGTTQRLLKLQNEQKLTFAEGINATSQMATYLANTHRATLNALLSQDDQERKSAEDQRLSNLHEYGRLLNTHSVITASQLATQQAELQKLLSDYTRISSEVLDLDRNGQRETALAMRIESLRPLFNRWQLAQQELTTASAAHSLREQKDYDDSISSLQRLLLGLVFVPAVLILVGILTIIVLLRVEKTGRKAVDMWTH